MTASRAPPDEKNRRARLLASSSLDTSGPQKQASADNETFRPSFRTVLPDSRISVHDGAEDGNIMGGAKAGRGRASWSRLSFERPSDDLLYPRVDMTAPRNPDQTSRLTQMRLSYEYTHSGSLEIGTHGTRFRRMGAKLKTTFGRVRQPTTAIGTPVYSLRLHRPVMQRHQRILV